MPKTPTLLRVFVASPGDVAEERERLDEVVNELNTTWSNSTGVYLELVKWETHTFPSFGIDAQSVINEQIADGYDIFIGIMWSKFGTPTSRAGSGTAEEFYRAYTRHLKNPQEVRLMFYFKDAPVPPSRLDPSQLHSVKTFQKELGDKGGLYWVYETTDDFVSFVRMHLSRHIQEWGKSWGTESSDEAPIQIQQIIPSTVVNEQAEEAEELGFIDFQVIGQEGFEESNSSMLRVTTAIVNLSKNMNIATQELQEAKTLDGSTNLKKVQLISNRVAREMGDFAKTLEEEVPIFSQSYSRAIDAFSRAFALTKDIQEATDEEIDNLRNSMNSSKTVLLGVRDSIAEFRLTIASLPSATHMLNRSRRQTIVALDKLEREFLNSLNLIEEMENVVDDLYK